MRFVKKAFLALVLTLFLESSGWAAPYAFPVPYLAAKHTEIFFKDLPGAGSIKIFTILGEEVVRIHIAPGQAILPWDVRNASGKQVASGVYIYLINAAGQKTTGKLVVIR